MNHNATQAAHHQASQETLQKNLINALTRLQHTAFEKEFLDAGLVLDENSKLESFFGFGIDQYKLMVAASCFCEVFVDTEIAAVPNAPDCLFGLSNIRGVLIPIYQLYTQLNLSLPKKAFIFVVGKGESAVGLLVDALPVSLSLSAFQREPLKQTHPLLQKLAASEYKVGAHHWLLLEGKELGAHLLALANHSQRLKPALAKMRESVVV